MLQAAAAAAAAEEYYESLIVELKRVMLQIKSLQIA